MNFKNNTDIVKSLRNNGGELELAAAKAIENLMEREGKLSNVSRVETPYGALIARPSGFGPENPGLHILLRRPDGDSDLLLDLIEFTADDGDCPKEGEGIIISRVYSDAMEDEASDNIVHKKIEKYFD